MSRWGLHYKTFEVVWPDEWNAIVDALDELARSIGFIIGVAKTIDVDYGLYKSVLPFSGELDAPKGMVLPSYLDVRVLACYVLSNTLDARSYIVLRKNESETDLRVEVPSNTTGSASAEVMGLLFQPGDRLDFVIDTTAASSGSLSLGSIVLLAFHVLPP